MLGLIAGLLVTVAMVPQLIRTFRMKNADEISLLFTVLLWTGKVILGMNTNYCVVTVMEQKE